MKKLFVSALLLLFTFKTQSQSNTIDRSLIKEDLKEILNDISKDYVYLNQKNTDLKCIEDHYSSKIEQINNIVDVVLFFEYLIAEFYDSHFILNTNTSYSYRLYAPVFLSYNEKNKPVISNLWQSQIDLISENILGSEILKFNGVPFDDAINAFPTSCNNKTAPETRKWIANKIVAGKYNEPRILTLKKQNGDEFEFDLDKMEFKNNSGFLNSRIENGIGIIRINNSLGQNTVISEFDWALEKLMDTEGLILDLRNTINGGNTYVARGIMSRFIDSELPYQKHLHPHESWDNQPEVVQSWVEYASPRGVQYKKPVVILVGRWTASMGEGLTIGLEAMQRAAVVGTEMRRLAGEVFNYSLPNQTFGFSMPAIELFHANGTARERYIPHYYVKQTSTEKDEILEKGILVLKEKIESVAKTDSLLALELESFSVEDQTLRLLLPDVVKKFGRESAEYTYIWSLINQQDSITVKKLIDFVETHGWVGKSRVGDKANQAIWLTIQHADLETQEKYLPLLEESVTDGESPGWHLAFLKDRVLMKKGEPQIYGTQAVWDEPQQKYRIYKIKDVGDVNERRKALGLGTVEEHAEQNGYIFDQKEK